MTTESNNGKGGRNQRYWQAHIKALAESGLSRAEYCRQQNISYHALTYWQRKTSHSGRIEPQLVSVPLPVRQMNSPVSSYGAALHITLPGNFTIAVGDHFAPATLNRLLTVLEQR